MPQDWLSVGGIVLEESIKSYTSVVVGAETVMLP